MNRKEEWKVCNHKECTRKTIYLGIGQLVQKGVKVIMKTITLELFDFNHKLVLKTPQSKNKTF